VEVPEGHFLCPECLKKQAAAQSVAQEPSVCQGFFPPRQEREILDFVLTDFPQPLAVTYARLHEEMDYQQPVPAAWQLRDCLEVFIKFFACVAVADFLQASPERHPGRTKERTGDLVALLLKPQGLSLGDWHALLRDALCELVPIGESDVPANTGLALPQLYGCFHQTGKVRRGNPILTDIHKKITGGQDTVIAWRNRVFGHGVFQNDPSWYADEVNAWLDVLHQFYRGVEMLLCGCPLDGVRLCSVDEDGNECEWHGTGETPHGFVHEHVPEGEPLSMFLKTSTKRLELSPLLTLQRCSVCGEPTVFFFDKNRYESKKDRHRTWFLEYFSGHHNDKKDLKAVRELASHVPPDFKWERTSYDQDEVDSIVRTLTQGFEGDYCRPDYLMDMLFSEMEEREKGYLHIVGPAGVGKSWLVRGMEADWKDEGVPVLTYYVQPGALADYRTFISELADKASENFRWRTQEIQAKVASIADLKEQFASFCSELMRANRLSKMVIAIDGLDELPEPEEGQPAITGLLPVGENLPAGCFVALTSRPRLRPAISQDLQRLNPHSPLPLREEPEVPYSPLPKGEGPGVRATFFSRIEIDPSLDENRKLLLAYLQNKLSEKWRREEWMEEIIRRAGSVFLYTFHLANALESGAFADVQSLPEGREFYPAYLAKLRERVGTAFFEVYYLPVLLYLSAVKEPVSLEMLSAWGLRADRLSFSLLDLRDFLKSERSMECPETLYQVAHQGFIEYLQEDVDLAEKLKGVHRQIGRFALGRHSERWDELDFEDPLERYHLIWTLEHLEYGELWEERQSLLLDTKYAESCSHIAYAQSEKAHHRPALALYEVAQRCYRYQVEEIGFLIFEDHLAMALMNKGNALEQLGRLSEAIVCHDEAIAIHRRLVEEEGRAELANELAKSLMNKGNTLEQLGQLSEAIVYHDEAIAIHRWLVEEEEHTELANDLAKTLMNMGVALDRLGHPSEAIGYYDDAIAIRKRLVEEEERTELANDLAKSLMNKGLALGHFGHLSEAIGYYDDAIAIRKRLVEEERHTELTNGLATALMNKGLTLRQLGNFSEAIVCYNDAIAIRKRLVEEEGRPELAGGLARALLNKGLTLEQLDELSEAIGFYDEGIAIYRQLVDEEKHTELANDLASALMNKGVLLRKLGQLSGAIVCYDEAITMRKRMIEEGRIELANELAMTLMNKGVVLERLKQWQDALECYNEGIELWEQLVDRGMAHLTPNLLKGLWSRLDLFVQLARAESISQRAFGWFGLRRRQVLSSKWWQKAAADVEHALTYATQFLEDDSPSDLLMREWKNFLNQVRALSNDERAQLYDALGEVAELVRSLVDA